MSTFSAETDREPAKYKTAETEVRRVTEIGKLSAKARSLVSGDGFPAVEEIVGRITERAHRAAGF